MMKIFVGLFLLLLGLFGECGFIAHSMTKEEMYDKVIAGILGASSIGGAVILFF